MNANDPSLIIFLSPFSTVRHPFFLTTNNVFIFHVLPVVFIIYRLKEIYFLCQKPWLVSRRIGIESIWLVVQIENRWHRIVEKRT